MPSLPRTKADSLMGTCRHPPLPNKPGKSNWIEKQGGLPREIDCVARAIYHGKGKFAGNESKAIEVAVGVVRNWAEGKGNVTAATRARAAAAVAKWESMRAAARGKSAAKKAAA